jgi:putative ABC transport system ATP-binding protein
MRLGDIAAMKAIKVVVRRHSKGYIAHPIGMERSVLGEGSTLDEAVANVKSALQIHSSGDPIHVDKEKESVRCADQELLIEMNRVWKYYELGEVRIPALKGIDFSVVKGDFVAVWGPSGSGKSTLCNLIGLIDNLTEGNLKFEGQEVINLSDNARSELRNRAIGFVFQHFNLIPVLSALENVMLPLQIKGESSKVAEKQAVRQLLEMGLGEFMGHRPDKLSGGQRQRVAIARALITDPALVIADEPTANLDSENALKIISLMREINQSRGTTFVFSTHDQRLLDRVQRQVRLQDGTIIRDERFIRNGD